MKPARKSEGNAKAIKLTVDKSLNKLKGKVRAPKKLQEANRLLKKLKSSVPQ